MGHPNQQRINEIHKAQQMREKGLKAEEIVIDGPKYANYRCEICNKTFRSTTNLQIHKQTQHEEKPADEKGLEAVDKIDILN